MASLLDLLRQRRPVGASLGTTNTSPLGQLTEERDPRLDNFENQLGRYEQNLAGQALKEGTGYNIPVASDLGNAVNAYVYGIKMNEYRDKIKGELDAQLKSEKIEKGSSEYWKEYTKRMPDIGSPEALTELGFGAALAVPVARGSFGALRALYNMMPKRNKEMQRIEEKAGTAIDQAEIDASKPQ
jgi:hypothetical protein